MLIRKAEVGRRGWTRTSDHLLRRQVLYPPELRARVRVLIDFKTLQNLNWRKPIPQVVDETGSK